MPSSMLPTAYQARDSKYTILVLRVEFKASRVPGWQLFLPLTLCHSVKQSLPKHFVIRDNVLSNSVLQCRVATDFFLCSYVGQLGSDYIQLPTQEFCSGGGGRSTNSVEDRGKRERGSGGGSPLVRGSGGAVIWCKKFYFI